MNPPVGLINADKPLLKPENTGMPATPINMYTIVDLKALLLPATKAVSANENSVKVIGTIPITTPKGSVIQIIAVKRAQITALLVFII